MKNVIFVLIFSTLSFSEICDLNNDSSLNIVDIVIMVNSILNEGNEYCDLNGDNELNIIDVVQMVNLVLYGMNIELIHVPQGDFNNPGDNETQTIDYDFKIGKYEITNQQYLHYLNSAIDENQIWIDDCIDNIGEFCVNGNYESNNQIIEKSFFILGNPYSYMLNDYNFGVIQFIDSEFQVNNVIYLDHPVVQVSWYGANHFAEYFELRLPTLNEWMRAAKAESNFSWPWGGGGDMHLKINVLNSQYNIPEGFTYPWGDGTTPVGFYKEYNNMIDNSSSFGIYDLIGNASEWILDPVLYNENLKLSVGGSWDWSAYNSRLKWNSKYSTGNPNWSSGFRIVQDY